MILWTCPKCGRKFEKKGQAHSCKSYALALHFKDKPTGKMLYERFKNEVHSKVGPFKIESLSCCIHFVNTFTFAAVKILRNKIKVDFTLNRKIKNKRIAQSVQMSANRYLYVIDILNADEIDATLMNWIFEAYEIKAIKLNRVNN